MNFFDAKTAKLGTVNKLTLILNEIGSIIKYEMDKGNHSIEIDYTKYNSMMLYRDSIIIKLKELGYTVHIKQGYLEYGQTAPKDKYLVISWDVEILS